MCRASLVVPQLATLASQGARQAPGCAAHSAQGPIEGCGAAVRPGQNRRLCGVQPPSKARVARVLAAPRCAVTAASGTGLGPGRRVTPPPSHMNMTSTHYYDRLGWSPLRIHTWPHSFTLAVSPAAQSGGREMPGGVWRPSRVGCGTSSHPGRGVWKSMSCDAPLTPRWLILQEP